MTETSFNRRGAAKKMTLTFALLNFLTFLIYYVCFYVIKNQATLYFYFYFSELSAAILPVIAATVLFICRDNNRPARTLLCSLYFSLTWILNLFPYYAFEYAYQMIEISAVVSFASIHTLFMVAIVYIQTTLLYFIMIFINKKIAKNRYNAYDEGVICRKTNPIDLSNTVTLSVFSASAAMFVYNLINEIVDTVSFIRDVEGAYETGEIAYIVFRYLFILAMLIVSHFISVFVKNRIISNDERRKS